MTRSLNFISSRLAFHELRIKANHTIMNGLVHHIKDLVSEAKSDEFKKMRLVPISIWLEKSLERLQTECPGLLLEVACNQKIAQSQLEIVSVSSLNSGAWPDGCQVSNLVAQRDTKDNLQKAKTSTEIAILTKDDSFAMRTIAIMRIIFLPGTFVAVSVTVEHTRDDAKLIHQSFFSMSVFNWQASGTDPVLSSRFWIYWAVTLPLTLLVFSVWLTWLHQHKSHEPKPLQGISNMGTNAKAKHNVGMWPRRKSLRLRSQTNAENDEADPEADGQSLPSVDAVAARSARPMRVDTLVQGPRR